VRLTRKADYAVRVIVDLASRPAGAVVPRARILERQDIPVAYLAKIVQALARAGLVRTLPGPRGGVSLVAPPAQITLRQVVEAVDRPLGLNRGLAQPVWARLQTLIRGELDAVTIASLLPSDLPAVARSDHTPGKEEGEAP
jgi:Rrf2 family protein